MPSRNACTPAVLLILLVTSLLAGLPHRAVLAQEATPAASSPATSADWPMHRDNPARDSSTADAGPVGQPVELWRFQAGVSAYRSPAVVVGVAFLGSADGVLVALDAATGGEVWRFEADGSVEITPPSSPARST